MDDIEHYDVKCNKLHGKIILKEFSFKRDCIQCEHGVVKPVTFERLAGRGPSKNWRRTVRCARTGKDIYTLLEAGVLSLVDEERKSKTPTEGTDSSASEEVVKRKTRGPGRPRKDQLSRDNLYHNLAITDKSSPEPHKRKRKRKNQVAKPKPPTEASSPSTMGTPEKVKASRKCKWKRTRCNNFEKSLNSVVRKSNNPLRYKVMCSICETTLQDSEALKYHDIMFHSSVSSKLFITEVQQDSPELIDNIQPECSSSDPHSVLTNKLEPSHDQIVSGSEPVMKDPGIAPPSCESPGPPHTSLEAAINTYNSSEPVQGSEDQTPHPNTVLLETVTSQYRQIIGLSRENLHQNNMVKSRLEELTQSINEIRSEVKDISKSLSDSDHYNSVNKSHDDVTELEYKTFFKVLDKFISKNGNGNGKV